MALYATKGFSLQTHMIWNIPSVEHIESARFNYSLISLLKKHAQRRMQMMLVVVLTQISAR